MIFTTWAYAVFLAVAFAAYWLAPARARGAVLIAFGFVFYAWWHPPHVLLIAATIPLVAWLGRRVAPGGGTGRRGWLALGVAACIGVLAFYKYQGFLLEVGRTLLAPAGVAVEAQALEVRPPLGVSFFVFEYVHYLVEASRGTIAPAGTGGLALFIMFFPTLICGPIKRYNRFRPDEAGARFDAAGVSEGLGRIVVGLAKKTLVADAVAPYCMPILTFPELHGPGMLWLGVYGYAVQIYFDFAGYSDIAIGSARLFGYRVPENFDYPYLQPDIARFWRAWHMSLTSWITDYVYIPLGGNRGGEARAALNRLVSMTLCGLWHGAALHFAVWGLYHGLMLNAYRVWRRVRERVLGPRTAPAGVLSRALATLVTFHVVCIGWVLFVCDLRRAAVVIPKLLGLG
jgi:alginate O-acetyltransferase complex protein AlgI